MKKQTAVQWLEECIKIGLTYEQEVMFEGLFQQALEMEKEQHNVTWKESRIAKAIDKYHEKETSFDDYYSQTFNKE